jgi:hypothetical protein
MVAAAGHSEQVARFQKGGRELLLTLYYCPCIQRTTEAETETLRLSPECENDAYNLSHHHA